MTVRIPLAQHTKASLDALYDENDRLRHAADPELRRQLAAVIEALGRSETELAALRQVARGYCPACGRGDAAPTVADWEQQRQRADQAERERDGAYRERAHLVAWLAALHPSVIAPAPDVDEPGWQILYLYSAKWGWQMTWHIHPRDAELFADVERVAADDPRAQWDGHTTEQKYNRMRTHVRVVQMNNRLGATSCPVCEGAGRCPACHTTMRAALEQPAPSPAATEATGVAKWQPDEDLNPDTPPPTPDPRVPLHASMPLPPAEQPAQTTPNNPPTSTDTADNSTKES